jgi:hypothetical protein
MSRHHRDHNRGRVSCKNSVNIHKKWIKEKRKGMIISDPALSYLFGVAYGRWGCLDAIASAIVSGFPVKTR